MNRRERIVVLLDNYVDVSYGMRDRQGDGEHLPLMCRAWNKPELGYPALVRLLDIMSKQESTLYTHLDKTYVSAPKKRVLQCPRCRGVMPSWSSINFHKHSHSNVAVVPRVIRVIDPSVKPELVDAAIVWLDEHWPEPGPFIPEDLKAVAA